MSKLYREIVERQEEWPWRYGHTRRVLLTCGHRTWTWAKKRTRCRDCESERLKQSVSPAPQRALDLDFF